MTGMLNTLSKMQLLTVHGFQTTSCDIATVRMADMTYVVLPNFPDSRILFIKVISELQFTGANIAKSQQPVSISELYRQQRQ